MRPAFLGTGAPGPGARVLGTAQEHCGAASGGAAVKAVDNAGKTDRRYLSAVALRQRILGTARGAAHSPPRFQTKRTITDKTAPFTRGGHVGGRLRSLADCCSRAASGRSGSDAAAAAAADDPAVPRRTRVARLRRAGDKREALDNPIGVVIERKLVWELGQHGGFARRLREQSVSRRAAKSFAFSYVSRMAGTPLEVDQPPPAAVASFRYVLLIRWATFDRIPGEQIP